jgi:hypothetical protein
MEDKLVKLREGVTLVRPEEREAIEEMYSEKLSQWRKRMFKDVWGVITENSPQDLKQFKVILVCFLFCQHMQSVFAGVGFNKYIHVFAGGTWT